MCSCFTRNAPGLSLDAKKLGQELPERKHPSDPEAD
jgi:hypothetical protein